MSKNQRINDSINAAASTHLDVSASKLRGEASVREQVHGDKAGAAALRGKATRLEQAARNAEARIGANKGHSTSEKPHSSGDNRARDDHGRYM